jgi:hypothetical protein
MRPRHGPQWTGLQDVLTQKVGEHVKLVAVVLAAQQYLGLAAVRYPHDFGLGQDAPPAGRTRSSTLPPSRAGTTCSA